MVGMGCSVNKDLREMGNSWEGIKREALDRIGWRRSTRGAILASCSLVLR